jgi:acyl-coenzyme A synthetase/AMP-(fatty) acid ligase
LKQLPPGAFPSLRYSIFGGEPLLMSYVEAWRKAAPNSIIENQYGPTEATVACTGEWLTDPPRLTPSRGSISIGVPFPGMRAGIVDPNGVFLSPGEIGELAVSGPQVAAGYFDDPQLTKQRFRSLAHPTFGRAVFYLTGDLAYEDADGHFHHLGRIDHQVKILGRRVELEEIESHLRAVTGGEAIVVAWPVQDGAHGVVAFVAGGEWTPEGAQEALRGRLPSYMVPQQILRRISLPLSANGKLNRGALLRELEQMQHASIG